MKKYYLCFLVLLLAMCSIGANAQTTVTLNGKTTSGGTFYRDGVPASGSQYSKQWVSASTPQITLSVPSNNMLSYHSNGFALYRGSSNCTYTLSIAQGYSILGIEMKFYNVGSTRVTLSCKGTSATATSSSSSNTTTLAVTGINSQSVSINLSASSNVGCYVPVFKVTYDKSGTEYSYTYTLYDKSTNSVINSGSGTAVGTPSGYTFTPPTLSGYTFVSAADGTTMNTLNISGIITSTNLVLYYMPILQNVASASPSKAYTMVTPRGYLRAASSSATEFVATPTGTTSGSNPLHQWTFVTISGKSYLYNVGTKKLASFNAIKGHDLVTSDAARVASTSSTYKTGYPFVLRFIKGSTTYYLNINGEGIPVIDNWTTHDDGNVLQMMEVPNVTVTPEVYGVKFTNSAGDIPTLYVDGNEVAFNTEVVLTSGAKISNYLTVNTIATYNGFSTLAEALTDANFNGTVDVALPENASQTVLNVMRGTRLVKTVTLTGLKEGAKVNVNTTIGKPAYVSNIQPQAITATGRDTTVTVVYSSSLPMELSDDPASSSATPYLMTLNGYYAYGNNANSTTTFEATNDSYQWTFGGDEYNGITVYNRGRGGYMRIGAASDNSVASFGATPVAYTIKPNSNQTDGFNLNLPGTNAYVYQRDGRVSTWLDARADGAAGSCLKVHTLNSVAADLIKELEPYFTYAGCVNALTTETADSLASQYADAVRSPRYTKYTALKAAIDSAQKVEATEGYYIVKSAYSAFVQRQKVEKAMHYDVSTGLIKWQSVDGSEAQIMKLTPVEGTTKFSIYSPLGDAYLSTKTGGVNADASAALGVRPKPVGPAAVALVYNSGGGTNEALHPEGHSNGSGVSGALTGWYADSEASAWRLMPVDITPDSIVCQTTIKVMRGTEVVKTVALNVASGTAINVADAVGTPAYVSSFTPAIITAADSNQTVTVTYTSTLPMELSVNPASSSATPYFMTLNSSNEYYIYGNNAISATNLTNSTNEYLWTFGGDEFNGITVYNRTHGYLRTNGNGTITTFGTTPEAYNIEPNASTPGGFTFFTPNTNRYFYINGSNQIYSSSNYYYYYNPGNYPATCLKIYSPDEVSERLIEYFEPYFTYTGCVNALTSTDSAALAPQFADAKHTPTYTKYLALKSAIDAAQKVEATEGYYIVKSAYSAFVQRQGVEKAIYYNTTSGLFEWQNVDGSLTQIMKLTPVEGTAKFSIYSPLGGAYISSKTGATTINSSNALGFRAMPAGPAAVSLVYNSGGGTNEALHTDGHSNGSGVSGALTGWYADREPSAWRLMPVDFNIDPNAPQTTIKLMRGTNVLRTITLTGVEVGTAINVSNVIGRPPFVADFDPAEITAADTSQTVEVTYTSNLPMELSDDPASSSATSYLMTLNGAYAYGNNTNPTTDFNFYDNAYLWTFGGNEFDGITVYNRAYGYMSVEADIDNSVATFGTTPVAFAIRTNTNENRGFNLNVLGTQAYINYREGKVSTWLDSRGNGALGSCLKVYTTTVAENGLMESLEPYFTYAGYVNSITKADSAALASQFADAKNTPTYTKYLALKSAIDAAPKVEATEGYYIVKSAYDAFVQKEGEEKAIYYKVSNNFMGWQGYNGSAAQIMKLTAAGGSAYFNIYVPLADVYLANMSGNTNPNKSAAQQFVVIPSDPASVVLGNGSNSYYGALHAEGHRNGNGTDGSLTTWNTSDEASKWRLMPVDIEEFTLIAPEGVYDGDEVMQGFAHPTDAQLPLYIRVYTISSESAGGAQCNTIDSREVAGGEGYVICGEKGKVVPLLPVSGTVDAPAGNMLVAGDGSTVNGGFIIAYKKGEAEAKFWPINGEGLTIPANRSYLPAGTPTRGLEAIFGGLGEDVTGISGVNADSRNAAIYDLQGRRVNKAEKGVYIINGKKVIK